MALVDSDADRGNVGLVLVNSDAVKVALVLAVRVGSAAALQVLKVWGEAHPEWHMELPGPSAI